MTQSEKELDVLYKISQTTSVRQHNIPVQQRNTTGAI
jgi:hypothetical protein